jgi:hypothetical protein
MLELLGGHPVVDDQMVTHLLVGQEPQLAARALLGHNPAHLPWGAYVPESSDLA